MNPGLLLEELGYTSIKIFSVQHVDILIFKIFLRKSYLNASEDGGRIGRGDHFLPHKFVERTFEHQANSTEELLNAGRVHQTPQKAAHCL